ncbi:MAG: Ppx/GppA phosphatase family protein [Sphingomonadales bacterium]
MARPEGRSFRVVDAFSRIVRLGEGLTATGALSDEAVERTIAALKVCARKLRDRGVTHTRNVATQACRQASNCADFVSRVRAETGIELDIIAPEEEARLAVMGCQALMDRGSRRAIVFDIGGGSTELIWTALSVGGPPRILGWTSVPLGVVNLSEMYPAQDSIPPGVYREMVAVVRERLERFDKRYNLSRAVAKGGVQMLGTSGTVTTLTSLHMELPRYDRNQVDGAWMQTADLRALSSRLSAMDFDARSRFGCMSADRADLVVAGCAILDAIFDLWPVERIRVADRGIREGMLIDLMGGQGAVRTGMPKKGRKRSRWRRGTGNGTAKNSGQKPPATNGAEPQS